MPKRPRVSPAVQAALITGVVVVLGVVLGAYFNAQLVADQFDRQRDADREHAKAAAQQARLQLDLADLRDVLDDTAEHLARATRSVDVLRDRCATAIREGVAPETGPILSGSPAYEEWQRAVDNSYREIFELRVDRERLRVRVSQLELFELFDELEEALRDSRAPCIQSRLVDDRAPTTTDRRLKAVREDTTDYFREVEATAGIQIDVPTAIPASGRVVE